MEWILALAIGVLAGSGVWLLLRPRTFQFIMGLALLGYAVNLFIFAMGRLRVDAPPVIDPAWADPASYACRKYRAPVRRGTACGSQRQKR